MFYTLVRTFMNFRKLQESIRDRKDRTADPWQQAQQQQQQQQQSPQGPSSPISKEPEVIVVSFNKVKGSMGLSIVAAKVSYTLHYSFSLSIRK